MLIACEIVVATAADQTPQRQGHSIYIRFIRIRYHINSHVPVP